MVPEKQIITADPDVTVHEISEEDEFLVIACDGEIVPRPLKPPSHHEIFMLVRYLGLPFVTAGC